MEFFLKKQELCLEEVGLMYWSCEYTSRHIEFRRYDVWGRIFKRKYCLELGIDYGNKNKTCDLNN